MGNVYSPMQSTAAPKEENANGNGNLSKNVSNFEKQSENVKKDEMSMNDRIKEQTLCINEKIMDMARHELETSMQDFEFEGIKFDRNKLRQLTMETSGTPMRNGDLTKNIS